METRYKVIHDRITRVSASRVIYDDGVLVIEGIDRAGSVAVKITFENVLVTRIADEGARLRLLGEMGNATSGLLVEDQESDLTKWVQEECLGTRGMAGATHYLVLIGEEITDVVSFSPPSFE